MDYASSSEDDHDSDEYSSSSDEEEYDEETIMKKRNKILNLCLNYTGMYSEVEFEVAEYMVKWDLSHAAGNDYITSLKKVTGTLEYTAEDIMREQRKVKNITIEYIFFN